MDNTIIRKANREDISDIMKFIKEYWSDNHILGNNREFLQYQHENEDEVTYILAEEINSHTIQAIIGYIPYGKIHRDVMGAIWKVNRGGGPFLGVELLNYLITNMDIRIMASCGINTKTISIYQYLGYSTGKLDHYYRIADKEEYRIAIIEDKKIIQANSKLNFSLKTYNNFKNLDQEFNFTRFKDNKPYKEAWYIEKRYFNHPIYQYKTFGIVNEKSEINTLLVTREQECNNSKILRIVDIIGEKDNLGYISWDIQKLIDENDYEYVDIYEHGLSKDIMEAAGFTLKSETNNIIPNYFEPFVQKNIDIYYFTTDDENFYLFKGDGDQDRPNFYIK